MSGKGTLKNFKTMLAEAKRPEHTVEVCLRGDLVAQHEQLEVALEQAQKNRTDSLDGDGVGELVDAIQDLEARMHDNTYPFVFRALPKPAYRALVAAHPPREDDKRDGSMMFNVDTFYPAAIRACVIDPVLDDAEWTDLLDEKLSDRQFTELGLAVLAVNIGEVSVPFSLAASRAKRTTAAE